MSSFNNLQLELQCLSLRQSRRLGLLLTPRLVERALGQHKGGLEVGVAFVHAQHALETATKGLVK